MFVHRIIISNDEIEKLDNIKLSIQEYVLNFFNNQIIEPYYYTGTLIQILKVDFQSYN